MEEWRDVVGFEEYFMISSEGRVWSKRSNKILKQVTSKAGYKIFSTKIGGEKGKNYCFRIHRLVAEVFLDPPEDYLKDWAEGTFYKKIYINHIDGDKTNNSKSNLEWCTALENYRHAVNNGLYVEGKPLFHLRRIEEDVVRYIRDNYKPRDSYYGARAMSRRFNVPHQTISKIARHVSYKKLQQK